MFGQPKFLTNRKTSLTPHFKYSYLISVFFRGNEKLANFLKIVGTKQNTHLLIILVASFFVYYYSSLISSFSVWPWPQSVICRSLNSKSKTQISVLVNLVVQSTVLLFSVQLFSTSTKTNFNMLFQRSIRLDIKSNPGTVKRRLIK